MNDFINHIKQHEDNSDELFLLFQQFINDKEGDILELINKLDDIIAAENSTGELIALINTKQDKYMKDRVLPTKYEIFFENGKIYYEEVQ